MGIHADESQETVIESNGDLKEETFVETGVNNGVAIEINEDGTDGIGLFGAHSIL